MMPTGDGISNSSGDGPVLAQRADIAIRVAQVVDIPALQAVAAASWWATYGDYLASAFIEDFLARAYSKHALMTEVADTRSCFLVVEFVAESRDELIGFGQVGPTMPRRDHVTVAPADLHRLYLLPTWQHQGIGATLLATLEGWLRQRNVPLYGAYVHERNASAQHFYARQGFTHKPECDVQDEWYLVKRLDGVM